MTNGRGPHMLNINSVRVFWLVNLRHLCIGDRSDFEWFPTSRWAKKRGPSVWLNGCLMLILGFVFCVFFFCRLWLYQGHITILQHHLGGYVLWRFFLSIDQPFRNTSKLSLEELKVQHRPQALGTKWLCFHPLSMAEKINGFYWGYFIPK